VVTAEGLLRSLRQLPGEGGVLGIVSVADEFFVIARTLGSHVRVMISDAIALADWSLAEELAEEIGLEWEDEDLDDVVVAGDVAICEDLGLDAPEMLLICEDDEAYIDEMVRTIAKRLGFSHELAEAMRRR
jgi:putative tRNA adenosine deaminase-associated protein